MNITQICREIRRGGGVSGVAFHLEQRFVAAGVPTKRVTLRNEHSVTDSAKSGLLLTKLRLLLEVVAFTIFGSLQALHAQLLRRELTICHSDAMFGDVYVNHGLHAAMIMRRSSPLTAMLRNPLHLFLLAREHIRHCLQPHKRVVCFAEAEAQTLLRVFPRYEGKIVIIPNGVDLDRFLPDTDARRRVRSEFRYQPADRVLVFVGHEFDRKGLSHAISALAFLPAEYKLLVVGGDSNAVVERHRALACNEGVDDRVQFAGTRPDVEACLNAGELFVLPSSFEAWPLVGLEAMACGKPVLMTNTGGVSSFVAHGRNGLLVNPDGGDIAAKAKAALADECTYGAMSDAARETASRHSWETVAQEYLRLGRQLVPDA